MTVREVNGKFGIVFGLKIKRTVYICLYPLPKIDKNISVSGELGSAKKDQVYMVISGLDQVDFGNKNQLTCITSGVIGAGSVQDENVSQCISEQKIIS